MEPEYSGKRSPGEWPERLAWHVFSVGVLGLLLVVLLIAVESLGEWPPAADGAREVREIASASPGAGLAAGGERRASEARPVRAKTRPAAPTRRSSGS
jgi:hypothetical protein